MKSQVGVYIYNIYHVSILHTHIDKMITLITHVSENFIQFSYELYVVELEVLVSSVYLMRFSLQT
jgi:hypothetical protein